MDVKQIEMLEALLAKATPGPWSVHPRAETTVLASDGYSATNTDSNLFDAHARNIANAALIVEAINAIPALLQLARAVSEGPRAVVDDDGFVFGSTATTLAGQTVALVPVPVKEG